MIVNPGDAPRDTPLTAGQEPHYRAMEAGLTPSETQIHGQMFRPVLSRIVKIYRISTEHIQFLKYVQIPKSTIPKLLFD